MSGNLNETILFGLQKFTNYSVQVLGFTDVDKLGPLSDPVYAMTDQDGKQLNFRLYSKKIPALTLGEILS